ncbi:hypothetical protein FPSE_04566 [Fusarium pseudograminearum CS3096]|uniref:Nephrocystin 3-like N-terminal domain-containing protein n=1 Tax=Fusarium pseudograminearum (strain CS3096) TaxID=1028729 RepID=K3VNF5_FUSPC|nr:hypothetical protein FPSE_04566 [Fusarium pseudograminearum CS3096]EKJ75248.1 hypothetical protein FPSE_04566 [Fusarium pseudograminearum CS3096]
MDKLKAADEDLPGSNKASLPVKERDKGKETRKRVGLTQVYPEPGSKYNKQELKNDIVALHGLDATSDKTWIAWAVDGDANSGDVNWLKDKHMLPRFMPDSRILTYQWNANYDSFASSDRFSGHAKTLLQDLYADRFDEGRSHCPIIFIASCFGGLLLAQSLVIASHPTELSHDRYSLILRHTIGAAFLGTPFRGSWATGSEMAKVRYETAQESGRQSSRSLIELLKQSTPDRPTPLDDLVKQFTDLLGNDAYKFPFICVYETIHTNLSAFKKKLGPNFEEMGFDEKYHSIVVSRNSATIDGADDYGFDVRHNMLHKFNGPDDPNFKKLRVWLVETANGAQSILDSKGHNGAIDNSYRNQSDDSSRADTRLADLPGSRVRNNPRNPEAREKLYRKLHFKRLENRFNKIGLEHPETCTWLLTNKEYQAWLDKENVKDHHGVLWLKGKPGTGKSTLMRFAVSRLSLAHPEDIKINFFFNARGVGLENSTTGMYQSLIYQLFSQVPRLKSVFDNFTRLELPEADVQESWELSSLQRIFEHAVRELESHRLWVFVDALDEGDEDEVRNMIKFFKDLGGYAKTANVDMRVLFASRHYPQIMISHKVEIILESEKEHYLDIERYIQSELYIEDGMTAQGIQEEVINRASSVFLWVVLVVKILNKAAATGMNQKQKLQELPSDLSTLFKGILTRDVENMKGTLLCVQWVLFSRKPLTREELYYAILHGANEEEAKSWTADYVSIEIMDAFILTCSKGLVQFSGETAQFIHETVRDFLLRDNGMQLIASDAARSTQGAAHDTLKSCCLNCISSTLKIIWGSGRPVRFDDLDSLRSTYDSIVESGRKNYSNSKPLYKTPLLHYALFHLLHHANAAEAEGVSQVSFIQTFQLRSWVYLRKVFLELGTFSSLRSTLLYTLAEEDLGSLIMAMLHADPHIDVDNGVPGSPIRKALRERHYDALIGLLALTRSNDVGGFDADRPAEPEIDHLLRTYFYAGPSILGPSILEGFFRWGDEMDMLTLLRSGRFGMDDNMTEMRCSPLSAAVERGYEQLVQFLLSKKDLDVNLRDDDKGLPPLSRAARNGRLEIARLLVKDGRTNVNLECKDLGKSPLSYAAEEGFIKVVKLLLSHPGIKVEISDKVGRSAMFHAAKNGHSDVVQLLLHTPGNDPTAKDKHGYTALANATLQGHEDVVKKILEYGQIPDDSKTQDPGKTPLWIAYQFKRHSIAQLLRAHRMTNIVDIVTGLQDANENAKAHNVTNLWWAAWKGNHLLVEELLRHEDVELNFRDAEKGRTPLWCAAEEGHEAVVKLLLERQGVDVESKDTEYGQTPLCVAARFGYREVVRLMLTSSRVVLGSQDLQGQTAWTWAIIRQDDAMMEMLGNR